MCQRDEINRRLMEMEKTWKRLAYRMKSVWGVDTDEAVSIVLEGTCLFLGKESAKGVDPLVILADMKSNCLSTEARGRLWWALAEVARKQYRESRKQTRGPKGYKQVPLYDETAAKVDCIGDLREIVCEAVERLAPPYQDIAWFVMYKDRSERKFFEQNGWSCHRWKALRDETRVLLACALRDITRERERSRERRLQDEGV
jgi:hypothetical protein